MFLEACCHPDDSMKAFVIVYIHQDNAKHSSVPTAQLFSKSPGAELQQIYILHINPTFLGKSGSSEALMIHIKDKRLEGKR